MEFFFIRKGSRSRTLEVYHSEGLSAPNLGGLSFGRAICSEPWSFIIRKGSRSRTLEVYHSEGLSVPNLGVLSFGREICSEPWRFIIRKGNLFRTLEVYHSEGLSVPNLGGLSFGRALGPEPWRFIIRKGNLFRTLEFYHSEGLSVPNLGGLSFGRAICSEPWSFIIRKGFRSRTLEFFFIRKGSRSQTLEVYHSEGQSVPNLGGLSFGNKNTFRDSQPPIRRRNAIRFHMSLPLYSLFLSFSLSLFLFVSLSLSLSLSRSLYLSLSLSLSLSELFASRRTPPLRIKRIYHQGCGRLVTYAPTSRIPSTAPLTSGWTLPHKAIQRTKSRHATCIDFIYPRRLALEASWRFPDVSPFGVTILTLLIPHFGNRLSSPMHHCAALVNLSLAKASPTYKQRIMQRTCTS